MKTQFTYLFETKSQVVEHLHFIASVVASMTVRHECLKNFEEHIALLKHSLFYLRHHIICDSLTFGFRVLGFDYANTKNYDSKYRKDKGDLVVKIVCTFDKGKYRLEYSSLFHNHNKTL